MPTTSSTVPMMPMMRPALAWSRPPYIPGLASISRTALAPDRHAKGESTRVMPPQNAMPTRPIRLSTSAVVADGWLAGGCGP